MDVEVILPLLDVVSGAAVSIHVLIFECLCSRFCGVYMCIHFGELLLIW